MRKTRVDTILFLLLLLGIFFLFFAGPDYYHASRSYKRIWDQGHIILYTLLTVILLRRWDFLKKQTPVVQFLVLVIITLSTGILLEFIQRKFSRFSEFGDIWRDFLGCLAGWVFFSSHIKNRVRQIFTIRLLVILLIFVELFSPFKAVVDEIWSRYQFPLLSGFETPFEIERWESKEVKTRTTDLAFEGKHSLRISLSTAEYSGIFLKYFPQNWEGWDSLFFAVYNPLSSSLNLTCRIHDDQHVVNGQLYEDRFNRRLILHPGWNQLKVSLEDVRTAPRDRLMQLDKITSFGIFAVRLSSPIDIFIDDIRLVRSTSKQHPLTNLKNKN